MFTIGRLAEAAGVNVETLRYYERRGLLDEPPRSASGYRQYPEDSLWRLTFIGRAKRLGFTLGEIRELLAAGATPESVLSATNDKLRMVLERQEELERVRTQLEALAALCASGDADCSTLTVTASGTAPRGDGADLGRRSTAAPARRRERREASGSSSR